MGGAIRFAVRKTLSDIKCVCGSTGSISKIFYDQNFVDKKTECIDEYIKNWEHRPYGIINDIPNILAPVEYGLLIVDYTTLTIFSMQYYFNPTRAYAPYFELSSAGFAKLCQNGRVKEVGYPRNINELYILDEDYINPTLIKCETVLSWKDAKNLEENWKKEGIFRLYFDLDLKPWKILDLDQKNCEESLKILVENDFVISKNDLS